MHTRNDSGVSVHSFIVHDNPPSPTLTNPDMIVPIPPWQDEPDFEGPHPLLEPEISLSQTLSNASISTSQRHSGGSSAEVAIATAVLMPSRASQVAPLPAYSTYEHGAPLSDIYEESEANATPTKSTVRSPSRSPSPTLTAEGPSTPTRPTLRHKKRNSSLSTSSGGSDVGDWENFDSSKILSSRVAADLAQMKREDMLDVDDVASRRQSREEEELAALNARAEKILENARKRLTNMEDNLRTARNSVLVPSRSSPHLGDHQQPVGGLYRSISAAGASKLGKRPLYPQIKTSSSVQHMRGGSDAGVLTTSKRYSRLPDVRSVSAMEYGSPAKYTLFPDTTHSPSVRFQPSPASSKGFNSPLPTLGEEHDSPSTAETTPESVKAPPSHGLGIQTSAAISRENVAATLERSSSLHQTTTPIQHGRTSSSASTRSTQELRDQMTDLKSRIADLKSKAQAENLRRRSFQSLRSSSPFTPGPPEQYYFSSPAYEEASSPVNTKAGVGWTTLSDEPPPASHLAPFDGQQETNAAPITPANVKFLDVEHMTPGTEAQLMSSARTDRNDPLLARTTEDVATSEDEDDVASVIQASQHEDIVNEVENVDEDDEDVEQIAENEEEQIYLNEVLEESLREAEVEPEVPMIPGSFLPSPDGVAAVMGPEAERHEDRLDAFDYENMFLHSAMGNYTGKSLNGSDSGVDSDSDDGSVETSRADARTPVDESDHSADVEPATDDEMEGVIVQRTSPSLSVKSRSTPSSEHGPFPRQLQSPPRIPLPQPPKPWTHVRNNSVDSVSTAATFETATEGESGYEENPMLNWDPTPSSSLGYSPNTHQAYNQTYSPTRGKHGFSSPRNGGRSPAVPTSPYSPHRIAYDPAVNDRAQYINDNGIPERFQGRTSQHSRQSSVATLQPLYRPASVATVKTASPIKSPVYGHQYSAGQARTSFTPTSLNSRTPGTSIGSPVLVNVSSSPQRKVVINRSLQQPQSSVLEPQLYSPPDLPLPDPPTAASSAALQAQVASPKQTSVKSPPHRPASVQKRTPPMKQRRDVATSPPTPGPVPNTEILMESLIKLADPAFTLAPGMTFADIDKELVLNLLRAVGSVVDGVLRAEAGQTGTNKEEAQRVVQMLRGRLEGATVILEGIEVKESGERLREV